MIIGKTTLNCRFLALLFQVSNGGFHESHAIHHPIPMLDVIDEGLSRASATGHGAIAFTRGGIGLVPGRPHDVPIFLHQVVQIDVCIR